MSAIVESLGEANGTAVGEGKPKKRLLDLLRPLSGMTLSQQRGFCAILGAICADAATRPLHWVYDRKYLERTISGKSPEFWPVSLSPYYTLPTGHRSCYNDLGLAMMKSLPPLNVSTDRDSSPSNSSILHYTESNLIASLQDMFSPSSAYAESMRDRTAKYPYDPNRRYDNREPIPGPWQHMSVTRLLDDLAAGKEPSGFPDLHETDGLTCSIPLIARLSSLPEGMRLSAVEFTSMIVRAASVLASSRLSLACTVSAGGILRAIVAREELSATPLLNASSLSDIVEAIQEEGMNWDCNNDTEVDGDRNRSAALTRQDLEHIIHDLKDIEAALMDGHSEAVERFGKPCANPGSFMGALLSVLQKAEDRFAYRSSIRQVMMAGGCNCSRANLAGACLGAAYGIYDDTRRNRQDDEDGDNGNYCDCDDDDVDREDETVPLTTFNTGDEVSKGIPLSWLLRTADLEKILPLCLTTIGYSTDSATFGAGNR